MIQTCEDKSMTDNVKSLFGGHSIGVREVDINVIKTIEETLQEAKSGEIVGIGVVKLHYDHLSSYVLSGKLGAYSTIGASTLLTDALKILSKE